MTAIKIVKEDICYYVWSEILVYNKIWLLFILIAKVPYIWLKSNISWKQSNIWISDTILLGMLYHNELLHRRIFLWWIIPADMMTKLVIAFKFKHCFDLVCILRCRVRPLRILLDEMERSLLFYIVAWWDLSQYRNLSCAI